MPRSLPGRPCRSRWHSYLRQLQADSSLVGAFRGKRYVAQRGPRILMVSQRANRHYGRPRWCAGGRDRGTGVSGEERRGKERRERDRRKRWWRWRSSTAINTEPAEQNHPSTTPCVALALSVSLSFSNGRRYFSPFLHLARQPLSFSPAFDLSLSNRREYNGCMNALQRR